MTTESARATSLPAEVLARLFVLGSQVDTLRDTLKVIVKSENPSKVIDFAVMRITADQLRMLRTQVRAALPADSVDEFDLLVPQRTSEDHERAHLAQSYVLVAALATFIDTTLNAQAWLAGYLSRDRQVAQVMPALTADSPTEQTGQVAPPASLPRQSGPGQYL